MKHLIAIFIFLGLFSITFAQNDSIPESPKSTEIETGSSCDKEGKDRKISISFGDSDSQKRVRTSFLRLDRGISSYLHKGSFNLPTDLDAMDLDLLHSSNWALHLVQQRISLHKKNRVNVTYGLTLDFNKYRFNNDHTLLPEQTEVTFANNADVDLKKNQLHTTHVMAPLMLGVRLKPKKSRRAFNLKAGVYGGFLLASKTTQKASGNKKIKVRDDFNLNKVRYGVTARAGYGAMNLYVNYNLSSLFKKGEQSDFDLQPISFGISIVPF